MITVEPIKNRLNHIRFIYEGAEVGKGIDYRNGFYEFRPSPQHFGPMDRTFKVWTIDRIAEHCEWSSYRHYGRRERFK